MRASTNSAYRTISTRKNCVHLPSFNEYLSAGVCLDRWLVEAIPDTVGRELEWRIMIHQLIKTTILLGACATIGGCKVGQKIVEYLPPRGSGDEVIYATSFDSPVWFWELGTRKAPENATIIDADPQNKYKPFDGSALRIAIPKGSHKGMADLSFYLKDQTGSEPEELYFRYYLRFGNDWQTVTSGKLPGIVGTYGQAGWGGRRANGKNGWSARGWFSATTDDGKIQIGFYSYHADMKTKVGTKWQWTNGKRGLLKRNRWYCIEQYVKLNTPGKNNGVLRGWVDGKPAFVKKDIRFRDVPNLKIERVWLEAYHGGSKTAAKDHHLYIDDVVISRKYIGPRPR